MFLATCVKIANHSISRWFFFHRAFKNSVYGQSFQNININIWFPLKNLFAEGWIEKYRGDYVGEIRLLLSHSLFYIARKNICVCEIYIYIYTYIYLTIIYIYRERETERQRERQRERVKEREYLGSPLISF